jgi:Ni,Fe-hydrogenase I cytochrome b subunit
MSIDTSDGHPSMDYRAHKDTYAGFVRGIQVLSGFIAIVLILMAVFLV